VKDENYLHIDSKGKLTAYNYMGDSKDMGGNCYRVAGGTEINASITGKTLRLSSSNSYFSVSTNQSTIDWLISGGSISSIRYKGPFISLTNEKIVISSNGESFVVDSVKVSTPSITDITGAICN
jgi:hypothetical protein